MPLSILIVLHDFSLGGTERACLRLARAWSAKGAKVTIFSGSMTGPLAPHAGKSVQIVYPPRGIERGPGSRLRLAKAAADYLHSNPADVCFIPGNYHWPLVPKIEETARLMGTRIVAQISADLRKPQRGQLRQALFDMRMRRLLERADAAVALSNKARLEADQIIPGKTTTIPLPAIDDEARPPLPPPAGAPVILGAGRLVPEKGFMALVEAFARLPIADARLVLAGSGPEEIPLRRRAGELGIEACVKFLGYVDDIRPALDAANLFVLASRFEGFGAVIIEALAAGRPVVITDCTPAAELLKDPSVGLVVPIDDVGALSRGIVSMLDRPPPDRERAAALVEHHKVGPVADTYLDLFQQLCSDRP